MERESVIYLAGGCFWGTEHFLKQINGVTTTQVGYSNSIVENPSYEDVCTGKTNAAETVRCAFNPDVLPLSFLLELYFKTIDPTALNKQGGDIGTQYRTGIYYTDDADREVIEKAIEQLSAQYSEPIVIEVLPLDNFYSAELYHQDYLDKNPTGYCHINPQLFKMAREANKK